MSFFVMFRLKLSSEGCCRSLGDSLDQRYGPRYLIECFPYLTVEQRGTSKSAFLREYTLFLKLKSSHVQVGTKPISNFVHLSHILSLISMFQAKEFSHECDAKDVPSAVFQMTAPFMQRVYRFRTLLALSTNQRSCLLPQLAGKSGY